MTGPAVTVAGVDGAKGGWLLVVASVGETGGLGQVDTRCCADFAAVRAVVDERRAAAIAVDMPLGLRSAGRREADDAARARLGPRRSSLFPTPVVGVLDAASHAEAVVVNRRHACAGISVQAWNLVPKIREFRSSVAPADCPRFFECHPETSFTELAGEPLASKKTAAGVGQRLRLLRATVDDLDDVLAAAPPGCGVDDVLDALAATWTAARAAAGRSTVLGTGHDDAGYPTTIHV